MGTLGNCEKCKRYASLTRIMWKNNYYNICGICLQQFKIAQKKHQFSKLCQNCGKAAKILYPVRFEGKVWKVCEECLERFKALRR